MRSSRAYIRRVWRVPKHMGAPYFIATAIVKTMVKHGWPAKIANPEILEANPRSEWFDIVHYKDPEPPPDFWEALQDALYTVSIKYCVNLSLWEYSVYLQGWYSVDANGKVTKL